MEKETVITPEKQQKKSTKLQSLSTALRKNLQRRKRKTDLSSSSKEK